MGPSAPAILSASPGNATVGLTWRLVHRCEFCLYQSNFSPGHRDQCGSLLPPRLPISKAALDDFYRHRKSLPIGEGQSAMIIESAFAARKYAEWSGGIPHEHFAPAV